ncbi:MAG: hypothetical protein AB7O43_12485 [Hyphomicrobiaceae bacterium]
MKNIVHPLADELGGLVESAPVARQQAEPRDTSWRWMLAAVVVIGAFAWFTR